MLLNASKSEAMLIGTRARLSKFDKNSLVTVAGARVKCGESLTSLGVVIDPHLSFDAPVNSIVSSCNYHLHAFRHIRPSLSDEVAAAVGRSIVMSRLDYCNSLLAWSLASGSGPPSTLRE